LFEFALDILVGHADLRDFAIMQQLLELAVGYRRHLLRIRVEILQRQKAEYRDKPIADVKPGAVAHIGHWHREPPPPPFRAPSLQVEPIAALGGWWSMIFSENRFPLFRIML
jgi:hypothetical protein